MRVCLVPFRSRYVYETRARSVLWCSRAREDPAEAYFRKDGGLHSDTGDRANDNGHLVYGGEWTKAVTKCF